MFDSRFEMHSWKQPTYLWWPNCLKMQALSVPITWNLNVWNKLKLVVSGIVQAICDIERKILSCLPNVNRISEKTKARKVNWWKQKENVHKIPFFSRVFGSSNSYLRLLIAIVLAPLKPAMSVGFLQVLRQHVTCKKCLVNL